MKISAGCAIIYNNKILFCHPTNAAWVGTFTTPKGGVNENESLINAAIRETKEEVGIDITYDMIFNINKPIEITYIKKKHIYKIVYIYVVLINSLGSIKLNTEVIPKKQLQLEEIDWAGFLNIEEIEEKAYFRYIALKEFLK